MRIVYKYHQNNTDPLHNAEEPSAVIEKEAESGPDEESEDYEHHPASPQYMLKVWVCVCVRACAHVCVLQRVKHPV